MTTTTATPKTIKWTGKTGQTYLYYIFPIGHTLKQVPGNYIFAKETQSGPWTSIYAGETGDLSERFDNHHKMSCIKRNGATHIHAHESSSDASKRRVEEKDITDRWDPPCNG